MKRVLIAMLVLVVCGIVGLVADEAKIGGNWQMALDTPHGPMKGALVLKQVGATLTGTFETEMFGKLDLTGKVEGKAMSFVVDLQGRPFTFKGSIDGDKMSGGTEPEGATWTAARQ